MITITFYTRKDDPSCQAVEQLLAEFQQNPLIQLIKVDVDADPALKSVFGQIVPVIKIGPYTLQGEITQERLQMTLGAARDRQEHLEKVGDRRYEERYNRARKYSGMDRFTDWLSNHYLAIFNLILFIFVGLPFLAPVLMKVGEDLPARLIYTVYSPLCHQMAFRSWFLFGEQAYYPRDLAGIVEVTSYETAILNNQGGPETAPDFIPVARSFLGNPTIGYKVAICERDVALYGGMLLFGIVYAVAGRKIKQVPWYIWLFLGLIPIGIDGASQLPSLIPGLPAWLPMRESTPFWRTLTGALFGGLTAWYLYPLIEETMKDTRAFLASKKEIISQTRS